MCLPDRRDFNIFLSVISVVGLVCVSTCSMIPNSKLLASHPKEKGSNPSLEKSFHSENAHKENSTYAAFKASISSCSFCISALSVSTSLVCFSISSVIFMVFSSSRSFNTVSCSSSFSCFSF